MSTAWKIVIAVILSLGIAAGGTYYYMNQKLENEKSNLQSQITELNKQIDDLQATETTADSTDDSTTTETDETAGWKTYTNSTYGFSFKYPSEFLISKDNLAPKGQEEVSPAEYELKISDGDRELEFWVNPGGFGRECGSDYWKATIVNNRIVIGEKTSNLDDEGCGEIHGQVWFGAQMTFDGDAYFINYSFDLKNRNAELNTIEQIIDTFAFAK